MKTNKCLIVAHGFCHQRTGYLVRIQRMVATMQKAGLEPRVVWFVPLKQILAGKGLSSAHLTGVHVTWLPTLPGLRTRWLTAVAEYCHARIVGWLCRSQRPLFVQAENTDAMRLCSYVTTPVIFDLHGDTIAETHSGMIDEGQLAMTPAAVGERRLVDRADHLICASRNLVSMLRHRHGSVPATTVVPCAADLEPFLSSANQRDAQRRRLNVSDRLVLCYLGGLSAWQCIEQTLSLTARLKQLVPEIYFLLITPNDPQPYQAQLDRIGRAGTDYSVLSLNASEVPAVLSAVDAGFLLRARSPINHVASPTKCGEYLAAGAPVICTRHAGDAALTISNTGAGLILENEEPSAPELERLANFLRDVAANRNDWQRKATDAAQAHCDWAPYEQTLINTYRGIGRNEAPDPALAFSLKLHHALHWRK